MRFRLAIPMCALLVPTAALAAVEGEGKTKQVLAVRTTKAPVIDGRLDDDAWELAPADDRFTQIRPHEGKSPTERTDVRILYDDRAIYVGVRCHDSQGEKIVPRLTRRDRDIETDWLAVTIDSRHDHSSGYVFQLSSSGVQLDGQFFSDTQFTTDWDAVWEGIVTVDSEGWTAEFGIPLTVLRFSDAQRQEWGLQVHRNVTRTSEQMVWTYWPSNVQGYVSRLGHIVGLEGLKPRRTLELRPFGMERVRARSSSGGALLGMSGGSDIDAAPDFGIDMKLGLTSSLTLDATINPDFGQVEADQVVLNLSRFETFFPEKRPFFLEGRDVFETPIQLFYPRRIGRPPSGMTPGRTVLTSDGPQTIVDAPGALRIFGATKLTGNITDRASLGVLAAVTAPEEVAVEDQVTGTREVQLAPARSYAVLRGRYQLGSTVNLGVTATGVNRLGDDLYRADANHDAYTQGVDGRWQSENGVWMAQLQAVFSERVGGTARRTLSGTACTDAADPGCVPITRSDGTRMEPGDVGAGGRLQVRRVTEHWWVDNELHVYSPKLDINDLGFNTEFNKIRVRNVTGYGERKPHGIFNNWVLFAFAQGAMTMDPVSPLNLFFGFDFEAQFRNFYQMSPELVFTPPGTFDPYETLDGALFERPSFVQLNYWLRTDARKKLLLNTFLNAYASVTDRNVGLWASVTGTIAVLPQMELEVTPEIGWDENAVRFYACSDPVGNSCTVETQDRNYLFADLDSGFISVTLRGTYTFSPRLSLQTYAQLFMAQGAFARYRELSTMGIHPEIHRSDLSPSAFNGDFDGDGLKDDDFQDTSLNLNIVLRWEPLPGSTLFGVFTRAQNAAYQLNGDRPRFRMTGLGSGPLEDVFLIKFVYFLG